MNFNQFAEKITINMKLKSLLARLFLIVKLAMAFLTRSQPIVHLSNVPITTLALLCLSLCAIAADSSKVTDQQNIQGVWLAQSASANGFKVEDMASFQYVFSGDKLTIKDTSGKEMKYSFRLDTTNSPKLFVLQPEPALTNATVCSAAYELSGDSLKVAMACPGSRPTEISDKNNQMLIVFKRKSP